MSQVIGRVRLSKGRVGYFDELTRIHLTISKPEAPVFAGMNTANLKRAVRGGVLRLVAGSLELEQNKVVKDIHAKEETKAAPEAVVETVVVEEKAPAKEEPKAEPVKEEKAEEPKVEEAVEEVKETATEEAPEAEAKTISRKRKTSK